VLVLSVLFGKGDKFMHGWVGRILHVDLSNSRITQSPTQPHAARYVGGRGLASAIYREAVAPEVGAFDPENRLIFMAGTLVATGTQAATRLAVVGKSPMTIPEGFCYGNIGGFVGAELKKAGFDGVVIAGRAPRPVYLWLHDGDAELRDASALWGQGAYRTGEMLQQAHGEKTRFMTTGVAGENLVRTAVIFASHQSASSAGFGAVMGSKNLKALAIRGTWKPSVADPGRLKELNRYMVRISHRLGSSAPPLIAGTKYENLLKVIGKGNCYQCGLECIRRLYQYGPGLEGYRKCQSMEYYRPWQFSREDEPVATFFDAPTLANDYSLETWELRSIIEWLYACHQSGSLTEAETGLPLSRIGTREFLEKLLRSIACREGFGDVLAEGLARAADKVSAQARARLSYNVAPIGIQDIFPPRVYIPHALLYSMEPRVHHNILHELPLTTGAWAQNQRQPGATPVTGKVFHGIARAFWGSDAAGDFSSYEGKALAAQKIQNRTYIKESLGLCDFNYPITYSLQIPGYVGDPELGAKLFAAVTGVAGEELEQCAERIFNLQRLILLREGRRVPEADFPPEYNFTEPLQAVSTFGIGMVPGPGEEAVSTAGNTLDRGKFTKMLQEYYRLRGWDEATGLPLPETLAALGLDGR
jgi:aldehyde:ferredoxin oxidoreductase